MEDRGATTRNATVRSTNDTEEDLEFTSKD